MNFLSVASYLLYCKDDSQWAEGNLVKAAGVNDRALKIRSAILGDVNDTAASMHMLACCQEGDFGLEKARHVPANVRNSR